MLWICAGLSQCKLAANASFILLELNPVPGQKELIFEKGEICHTANLDKAEKMQMGRSCRRHSGDRPAAFSTCRRSQRADRWDSGSPQQSPVPRFPCRSAGHAGGQTALLAPAPGQTNSLQNGSDAGSSSKKIMTGPWKVFLDVEQAGDVRNFSLPPVKSLNAPCVLGLHKTPEGGAGLSRPLQAQLLSQRRKNGASVRISDTATF